MEQMPTPDLAVPYAAPKHVKTMADVQPMAPKNGCSVSVMEVQLLRSLTGVGSDHTVAPVGDGESIRHRRGCMVHVSQSPGRRKSSCECRR
jgi:hypothetical protein